MQHALNVKNFNKFAQQLRGARVTAITVSKVTGPKGGRLRYRARDPRTGRVFNGEWVLDEAAEKDESEFLALAARGFVVERAEG